MKIDLTYSDETLFVDLYGVLDRKTIRQLKNKIDSVIKSYQINDVIINTGGMEDNIFLDDLIYNYRIQNINIKKGV